VFDVLAFDVTGRRSSAVADGSGWDALGEMENRLAADLGEALQRAPAGFDLDCQVDRLPVVTVVWEAVFPTAGFAQFRFGGADGALGAASLFLSRLHAGSDEAIIASGEEMLAGRSRASLANAFAMVRQHARPVSVNFALCGSEAKDKLISIAVANAAMAQAFFGRLGLIRDAGRDGRVTTTATPRAQAQPVGQS
jgi:hypothetical protein